MERDCRVSVDLAFGVRRWLNEAQRSSRVDRFHAGLWTGSPPALPISVILPLDCAKQPSNVRMRVIRITSY